jgi:hypothetical protein
MEQCGSLAMCPFFNVRIAHMPMVSDALKTQYCRGDWTPCARRRLIGHSVPVPEDLYPDDLDRALQLIATAKQSPPAGGVEDDAEVAQPMTRTAPHTDQLQVGLGTSEADDAETAGREAATAATHQLQAVQPALVLVYASVRYDLTALLRGIREVTGATALVGASSSGHFHAGQLTEPERGVSVLLLSAGSYQFGVATASGLHDHPFATGRALATAARSALPEPVPPHSALLALPCGMDMDLEQFIDGIHRVAGAAVPVVGGAASDDRHMRQTYVFHNDQVLTDAAVGVWIASPQPLRVVAGHGWQARGLPMEITGFDGPLVRTIDGHPAMEVFQQQLNDAKTANDLGASSPDSTREDEIVRLAEAGRCLGIIEPDGTRMLRGVFAEPEGRVRTWLPLPPYAAVQIMTCTQDQLLDVCDEIGAQAAAVPDAGVMLAFSCVARLRMLRERGTEEAQRLQRAAGQVPVFGFYSYGELAGTTSNNGVHNATLTALVL